MDNKIIKYYTSLGLTIGGIALGVYFIFNFLLKRKIFLIQTMNDKEKAINIYREVTKLEQEAYERYDNDKQKAKRINALKSNNENEYNALIKEFLSDKFTFVYEKRDELLASLKLPKKTYENVIDEESIVECEEKLFEIYQPKFNKINNYSRAEIKKLIIEIADSIDNALREKIKEKTMTIEELNYFRIIQKQKMEDLLYDKCKLSLCQLKYLAFINDIIRDEEIVSALQFLI